jgi:hypothetical protein
MEQLPLQHTYIQYRDMARDDTSIFVMFPKSNKTPVKTKFHVLTSSSLPVTLRIIKFNIKKFYIVIIWNWCVLYGSRNKQQNLPYVTLKDRF